MNQQKRTVSNTFLIAILAAAAGSLTGCENVDDETARNTGIGAAAGAVIGGAVADDTAEGAAMGAAVGGAGGYGYTKATEDGDDD